MRSRTLHIVERVAFALSGFMLILSAATFMLDPWNHRVSLGSQFHVGVWRMRGDTLGRIMFFSDADYGPYRGSLIGLINGDDIVSPFDRRVAWGDSCGVYYRWFHRPDGTTLWTMALSLWYPLMAFLAISTVLSKYRRGVPCISVSQRLGRVKRPGQ